MKRSYTTIDVDKLKQLVSESLSFTDILRKLGKKPVGGSLTNIRLKCKRNNIDTTHFTGQAHNKGKKSKNKLLPNERLVMGKPTDHRVPAQKLRTSLFEMGYEYKCVGCGITQWQNKPLVLEIDHKDGRYWNNTPNNLQFICPNCHSQKE